MLFLLASLLLGGPVVGVAYAQDLGFNYTPSPKAGENPAVLITPARAVANLYVEITVGGKTITTEKNLAMVFTGFRHFRH